jgi:hypothetical protein
MSSSDRVDPRRPLLRFIAQVAIFFTPLFVAAYFLDDFISGSLRKSHIGELGAWNEVFAGHIDSDVVIYGTSRVVGQFNSRVIGDILGMSTYNLGMQGNNFRLQYLRHAVLLSHDAKPKVVLQSVEPFTFLGRRDPFDADQLLPFMLKDPQVNAATASYVTYNYWDRHLPMVRYYGKPIVIASALGLSFAPNAGPSERDRGFMTRDDPWDGNSDHMRRYWLAQHLTPDEHAIKLFDEYLRECRATGIKVVFVSPPEYVDAREFVPYRTELSVMVRELSRKYEVPLLDYSQNWLTRQPSMYFDPIHLNSTGAKLFSAELAKDVRALFPEGKS